MESKLTRWCDGFLEIGWLMAVIATPLFFNIHSERVFEPDKLTLLRSVALLMALVWIVKFVSKQGWQDLSWLKWNSDSSIWRMPLVGPVFAVVVIYLLSSIFSVAPRTSWLGSYQRLQGTYTTLSYIVVFAVIASTMRTRGQVQRLITTIIVCSIPVSLYGILQRLELDPLPWGGNTSRRIAGHMGNSIFVGAYLVMAIPLTATRIIDSFYHILTDEELDYADVIRSSIYLLTIAIQIIATYFTQSRGPLLGLGIGLFAFALILLVALRDATGERFGKSPSDYFAPVGYLVAAIAALFVTNSLVGSLGGARAFYLWVGLVALLVLSIFVMAGARVGWRWLWTAWLVVVVYVGLVLALFNVANTYPDTVENVPGVSTLQTTFDAWGDVNTINRLGEMLNTEAGTSTVRLLIWSGVLDLIRPHEPIAFPDGETDRWNFLRPIIGYGPESMYVAYNRFYPPELAVIEARNASPDRSHNETFDALVITGGAGFLAWQILYLATFLQAFRSVGVVKSKNSRNLFIGLWIVGSIVVGTAAGLIGGGVYLGIAIPFGSVLGLVLYLVIYALQSRSQDDSSTQYDLMRLTMIGIIAAMIAYYVEIHFGIAIASTRTHAFVLMGLIFVLSYGMRSQEDEVSAETTDKPAARRARRSRVPQQGNGIIGPVLGATVILSLVMVTLVFDFVNFSPTQDEVQAWRSAADLPSSLDIFQRSMMVNPRDNFAQSPYLYAVFVLSWLLATLLIVSEMVKEKIIKPPASNAMSVGNERNVPAAILGVLALFGIGVFFVLSGDGQTNTQRVGAMLAALWGVLSILSVAGLFVMPDIGRKFAGGVASVGLIFGLPLLIIGSVWQGALLIVLCAVALYFLWDSGWDNLFTPLITVGLGSYSIAVIYGMMHSSLVRSSFIAPSAAGGQPLQGLERNIVEAERIGAYLTTYYSVVIALLLLAGLLLAWNHISRIKTSGSVIGFATLAILLIGGFYLVDRTNLNIIQADMTYKRGKPYDQQAGQLSRSIQQQQTPEAQQQALDASVSNWKSAVAIYERAVEMAPSEDFYYLWLGRAYLEESSVNQAEQTQLLETARERLLAAQDINPLNTDHTANLARLNVRWAQLDSEGGGEARIEDAKNFYIDALALSPQNSIIRNEYAGLALSLDASCDDAIAIYQESIEVDPFYDQTYYRLTETYINCGRNDSERAVEFYGSAKDTIDSMFDNLPERLLRRVDARVANLNLQIAQAYAQANAFDEARDIINAIEATDDANLQAQTDALLEQINLLEETNVIVEEAEVPEQ